MCSLVTKRSIQENNNNNNDDNNNNNNNNNNNDNDNKNNNKLYFLSALYLQHGVANWGHPNINNKKIKDIHLDVCELRKTRKQN